MIVLCRGLKVEYIGPRFVKAHSYFRYLEDFAEKNRNKTSKQAAKFGWAELLILSTILKVLENFQKKKNLSKKIRSSTFK